MPILSKETDCQPADLLDLPECIDQQWWMMYTRSRQEKTLMRALVRDGVQFYGPQIAETKRSPAGRSRVTHIPLFTNYVFVCGDAEARYQAICSGSVIKATEVCDAEELVHDLRQIRGLIEMGVPLSLESRIQPGHPVRIKTGTFAGYEGIVIRREKQRRLLVSVRFMQQGVSATLDDCQIELLDPLPTAKQPAIG